MRFTFLTLLAFLGSFALVAALSALTTPDLEFASLNRLHPRVPAPQPAGRLRQATRAGIVARQARGPAKRQVSSTPICMRPVTGTTPYAIFTDAIFDTDYVLADGFPASLEECYAYCEQRADCLAVDYLTFDDEAACRPLSGLSEMYTVRDGKALYGEAQAEAKGVTCAQVKGMYPYTADWNCCDVLRA